MKKMLELEGFLGASLYTEQLEKDPNFLFWTVHYKVASKEALESYFKDKAPILRKDGVDRFGANFSISRRVLSPHSL